MRSLSRLIRSNPVYIRHMRLRVRSLKFALSILVYDLVLALILFFGFEAGLNQRINRSIDYSAVVNIYMMIVCVEIIMVICMIPAVTAASISAEKERQTLDILLSTGISPWKIVMGKFAESESVILIYVISSLPVVSMIFTVGGVSVGDIIISFIEIIVTSIFIGTIGILASAYFKKTIAAVIASYAGIVFFCVVTVLLAGGIYLISRAAGNTSGVSWTAFFLMQNPAADAVIMLSRQSGSILTVDRIMNVLNISTDVREHWMLISSLIRIALSAVFMSLAVRKVSPLKGRHKA